MLEQQFESLLEEFKEQREAIKQMVNDLEVIKIRIHTLIPETLDSRYVRFFEEKVKALTALFNVLLDMRKEINTSLKTEIELRRKVTADGDLTSEIEGALDIRGLSRKIEEFKIQSTKLKEDRSLKVEQKDEYKEQSLEAIHDRSN